MEVQYLGKNKSSIAFVGEWGVKKGWREKRVRFHPSLSVARAYVNLLNSVRDTPIIVVRRGRRFYRMARAVGHV